MDPADRNVASPETASAQQPPVLRRRSRSWAPIVVVAAVAAIGLAVVGSSTSGGAGLYDYSLAQLASAGRSVEGRDIKVSGNVAHGSVRGEPGGKDFRFDLDDGQGHRLTVAYPRLLPDPFEEGRTAIVQGRIEQGVLQATNLTVKCPSRYADGAAQLSEAEQQRYYQGAYRQHQAAQAGRDAAAAPAAATASTH